MDLPTLVEKYWAEGVIAVGGLFGAIKWLADRKDKRAEEEAKTIAARAAAEIDLTRLAKEVSAEAIETLRDELHRQALEIRELRQEIHDIQSRHIAAMTDKDAEISLLRGRNRQLEASIAAHRRMMVSAGLDLPPEPAFFEITGGELKTMGDVS